MEQSGKLALTAVVLLVTARVLYMVADQLGQDALVEPRDVAVEAPSADAAQVSRGQHLIEHVLVCTSCHGSDMGGAWLEGNPSLGKVWASNLTRGRGGVAKRHDHEDWTRAIRHGVGRDDLGLVLMPAQRWRGLADEDLRDVIAALEALPPVDREGGEHTLGPALKIRLAMGGGMAAAQKTEPVEPPERVEAAPDARYGAYLATIAGCDDCHDPTTEAARLRLGPVKPPDFRDGRGLEGWDGATFADAVTEGRDPSGRALDPSMPSAHFAGMDTTELDALWLAFRRPPNGGLAQADSKGAEGTIAEPTEGAGADNSGARTAP